MSSVLPCNEPAKNNVRSNLRTLGLSDWPSSGITLISISATVLNNTFVH